MTGLTRCWVAGGLAGIVAIAALTVALVAHTLTAQAGTLSESEAAALSVKYAQSALPVGQIVSTPTHVNAKLTTLGAAYQLKDGRPLDASTRLGRESNRAVWLVFLRGEFSVPNPVLAGKPAPTPVTYHQMGLIFDATTGELLAEDIYPVTHEVAAAASLPVVAVPVATNSITLPRVIVPTEAPLPTRAVLGAAPQPGSVPILVQVTPTPVRSSDRWSLRAHLGLPQ